MRLVFPRRRNFNDKIFEVGHEMESGSVPLGNLEGALIFFEVGNILAFPHTQN